VCGEGKAGQVEKRKGYQTKLRSGTEKRPRKWEAQPGWATSESDDLTVSEKLRVKIKRGKKKENWGAKRCGFNLKFLFGGPKKETGHNWGRVSSNLTGITREKCFCEVATVRKEVPSKISSKKERGVHAGSVAVNKGIRKGTRRTANLGTVKTAVNLSLRLWLSARKRRRGGRYTEGEPKLPATDRRTGDLVKWRGRNGHPRTVKHVPDRPNSRE